MKEVLQRLRNMQRIPLDRFVEMRVQKLSKGKDELSPSPLTPYIIQGRGSIVQVRFYEGAIGESTKEHVLFVKRSGFSTIVIDKGIQTSTDPTWNFLISR